MKHCKLLVAAFLLSSADAINLRITNHTSLVTQHASSASQRTKAVSNLVSTLWSDLVIEGAEKPADFDASDKAVETNFLKDCAVALDVHEDSIDSVDKVIKDMCSKAGGTGSECGDMTKTLWQAHKDEKLQPWCEKTYAWFVAKTKPKCLKKCNALLCQDRCKEQDKVNDLSDQIAAYDIKLDTVASKEKRLTDEAGALKKTSENIEQFDKSKCSPAGEAVKKLEADQLSVGKDLAAAQKTVSQAEGDKDKAFEALKKLRADKKAKKEDASKAEAEWKKATDAFNKASAQASDKNKSLKDVTGKLTEAKTTEDFQCKKLKTMQETYAADKKQHDSNVKETEAELEKLKAAKDKVIATKKDVENGLHSALKAL